MRAERRSIPIVVTCIVLGGAGGGARGSEEPIVARVGPRVVTQAEYESRLAMMEREFVPDTLDLAGKREFLQLMISKEIMSLQAEALGFAADSLVHAALASSEETLLHQKALEKVLQDADQVSEEEVQRLYEKSQQDIQVRQILLATRAEAEDVLRRLRAGADFDSMVAQVSIVPRIGKDGQDLSLQERADYGWVQVGQVATAVENAVWNTPLQQVSEPVESIYGWHLFLPSATRPRAVGSYAQEEESLREQLRGRKRSEATNRYYDSILQAHGFVIDLDVANIAYGRLPAAPGEPVDAALEMRPLLGFTDRERQLVLFEVDGKKYTLGDMSDRYDAGSPMDRPQKAFGSRVVYAWIRDVWLKPLQIERARQDGIGELPEVADEMRRRRELFMVGRMHEKLVGEQVPEPTEAELRRFYDEHPGAYIDVERRVCDVIMNRDESVVRRAYEEVRGGADFVDTARRYLDEASSPEDTRVGPFSRAQVQDPRFAAPAFALTLHEVSQPFQFSQGWAVLRLAELMPERRLPFEDAEGQVLQDWRSAWSEKRLADLLAEWRKEYSITVDEKVLAATKVSRDDVFIPAE